MNKFYTALTLVALAHFATASFDQANCIFTNDNGDKYDLSSLSKSDRTVSSDNSIFYVRMCQSTSTCTGNQANSAVCQISDGEQYSCGKTATMTISESGSGLTVAYTDGSRGCATVRSSTVNLVCDENTEWSGVVAEDNCRYTFSVRTKAACKVKKSSGGGLSAGSVILIIVACLVVVYVGGGMAYNYKFQEKRGIEMVPQLEFWKELPFLCKDGFMYLIHGFKKESEYTSM